MREGVVTTMKLGTLLLFIAIIVVISMHIGQQSSVQASGPAPLISTPVLVIEVNNGRHGSIWRFHDGNRVCYFNSAGGVWCTN